MKAIIIDDEPSSVEALQKALQCYEEVNVCATADNGLQGINLVKREMPDLLFLDVELPDMSGLDFLEQIEYILGRTCKVVIYTAHGKYMLPAFRNKAFDFLLKPIDDGELRKIMQRYALERDVPSPAGTDDSIGQKDKEKLILYTNATDFRIVNTNDVGMFQYNHEQRVWEAVVAGREQPVRLKRSANNDTLIAIDPRFIQVSQKFIVNINYLMEVSDSTCHFYPPFDQVDYVKVGRQFRKKLIERFSTL